MQNPPRARPAPKAGLARYPARLDPYMRPVLNLPVQSGSKYAFKAPRLYLITTALRRKLELTLAIFFSHSFVTMSGCFHVDSATLACVAQRETKYALKSSCEERRGSATAGLWQDSAIKAKLLSGFLRRRRYARYIKTFSGRTMRLFMVSWRLRPEHFLICRNQPF